MVEYVRRQHRYLNLVGMSRPWTCSIHNAVRPAGAACPECLDEMIAHRLCEAYDVTPEQLGTAKSPRPANQNTG